MVTKMKGKKKVKRAPKSALAAMMKAAQNVRGVKDQIIVHTDDFTFEAVPTSSNKKETVFAIHIIPVKQIVVQQWAVDDKKNFPEGLRGAVEGLIREWDVKRKQEKASRPDYVG